jgi:transposase-like protein
MATLSCKSCGGTEATKSGFVRGLQRYRYRACGCNFTKTPPRGKPAAMKAMAVLLYAMGNMSFGMIGRLLGVSDVSILRWVRAEAEALPEPAVPADAKVLVLDEMWHFVEKKSDALWLWRAYDPVGGRTVPGFWAAVMMQPAASFSPRRERRESPSSPTIGTDLIG